MARSRRQLAMPIVESVELDNFSLYRLRDHVQVSLSNNVTCLVGANGIGKSTFLASLQYSLTGAVPPPAPRFNSIGKYHSLAAAYAPQFFDGRIAEHDRDSARLTVDFYLAGYRYRVERMIFSPGELAALSVMSPKGRQLVRQADRRTGDALHARFQELVVAHTGLASFAQFVFLMHFLVAFDERRHLLFFDTAVAEKVIYLSFGMDPAVAERADELRRVADAADSLMRNFQYDATVARKQLEELRAYASTDEAPGPPPPSVLEEYERLREDRSAAEETLGSLLDELSGARLALAEAAGRLHQAEASYSDAFSRRLRRHAQAAADHPLVRAIFEDSVCGICGTEGEGLTASVAEALSAERCPLCRSDLHTVEEERPAETDLLEADAELTEARHSNAVAQSRVARLSEEVAECRDRLATVELGLTEIERSSPELAAALDAERTATLDVVEGRLRAAIHGAEQQKEMERTRRDAALAELQPLQQQLMATFAAAQSEFVPRFRELAEEFIGLPLDVALASAGKAQVRLILTVQGQRRTNANQLSESQRYFLDVALRMALAEQLTGAGEATFLIDTPEGSLDIAYEARVGSMFARFVERGNRIVMTANVNSSQLLFRLARECGPSRMAIERMTDWTTLSDVQVAEEKLFTRALDDIERELAQAAAAAK